MNLKWELKVGRKKETFSLSTWWISNENWKINNSFCYFFLHFNWMNLKWELKGVAFQNLYCFCFWKMNLKWELKGDYITSTYDELKAGWISNENWKIYWARASPNPSSFDESQMRIESLLNSKLLPQNTLLFLLMNLKWELKVIMQIGDVFKP